MSLGYAWRPHFDPKAYELENGLDSEDRGEHDVQVLEHCVVPVGGIVSLQKEGTAVSSADLQQPLTYRAVPAVPRAAARSGCTSFGTR